MGLHYYFKFFCITMNSRLIDSLISYLITYNNLESKNQEKIIGFVNLQISKMPDYFFFGIRIITYVFDTLVVLIFFKSFINLSNSKKKLCISYIKTKNIPVFSLFIRFIESNILVKYFELENEN